MPPHYPPGVPDIIECDFVGASHKALVDWLQADYVTPEAFHRALIETIERHGATHNQRALIQEALGRIVADQFAALAVP